MENFIVSARKYRPTTFASVVGQKHITSTLKNAIERGQLAHAYLFCGPRGVGKTTCARIFAKAINCQHPHGAEACNECESCRSFNEGRSLNIHELDAASNNSVDDIRNLIDQVRILPQGGRYSVFIIDEVHMLSAAAFNAFLKTLEEPPAHAIFILATTEKHKILPTILSRCQIYDFNRIRVEDAVEYLKYIAAQEGVGYDEESLNLIAQKADGGMRDALSMFDKAVSFCGGQLHYREVAQTLNVLDYDTYFNVTDQLLAGDYIAALRLFDEVLAKGFSGQTFMAGLARHMRDLLVARDAASLSLIELTGTLLERYRAQAGRCTVDFLFGAIALLTDADGRIRQASNQRLLVELGLMKIAGKEKKKNNGLTAGDYPLPPLAGGNAPTANTQTQTGQAPQPAGKPHAASDTPASATPQPPSKPVTERPLPATNDRQRSIRPNTRPVTGTAAMADATGRAGTTGTDATGRAGTTGAVEAAGTTGAESPGTPTGATNNSGKAPSQATLIGGTSLSALLSRAKRGGTTSDPEAPASEPNRATVVTDPASGEKLELNRRKILDYIGQERPRLYAFFEQLQIDGHTLRLSVPSEALREEILRNKTEILGHIAALAGIDGALEFEIKVSEEIRATRPIKLEDRIRYMTEKNPLLNELRKALDLEAE